MARDPNNLIKVDYNSIKREVFKVQELETCEIPDYDLDNPKDFPKYLAAIEKICRGSFEYRLFTNFLRDYVDMNKCSFFENVTNIDSYKIKIHIHHEPVTLFDIVIAVYNKRFSMREDLDDEMVAKEVMYNHYKMNVGLIPLSETVHELVHNQYLFVPTTAVFGQYWDFINIYKDFIEPEQLENIKKCEEASKHYDYTQAEALLNTNMIFVDTSGSYKLPKYEDVIASMKDRVEELKTITENTK
jgi:hypothetical protein